MTEADLYNRLKSLPEYYWQRIESANTGSGIPDLNGIHGGREFWLELKIGTPRLKPSQVSWHTRAHAQGRRCFVLTVIHEVYILYRAVSFGRVDSGHFTPTNDPLVKSPILTNITPYLTKTYN